MAVESNWLNHDNYMRVRFVKQEKLGINLPISQVIAFYILQLYLVPNQLFD